VAQQYDAAPQYNAAPPQRRSATAPQQQPRQLQQPQQRPAATAPRTAQGTQPVRRAPATTQQPGRQYPVRQTGGSEPLPQQGPARRPAPQQGPAQQQGIPQQGVPQQPATPTQPGQQTLVPVAPAEPFVLTAEQQRLLDQILQKWEQESDSVNIFSCRFYRWEVNETFGPPENNFQISEASGDIKYHAPDHGAYIVKSLREWDTNKKALIPRGDDQFDHWVCNGESIFEFSHKSRQLIERQLAPEMRGKAITDGPLPFVFGTKAAQLKLRYWMRDVTPTDAVGKQVWLEAWPKHQRDAANFHHAFIILDQKTFLPSALRIVLPDGKNSHDYRFDNISKNSPLAVIMSVFDAPRTPFGWTKVVIPPGGDLAAPGEQPAVPPQQQPAQAQQPRAQTQR
jgi:TIGR03009 family protein